MEGCENFTMKGKCSNVEIVKGKRYQFMKGAIISRYDLL